MNDHPSDVEFAVTLAIQSGGIAPYEERAMRALISQSGLHAFENLLRMRERGAQPDDIYKKLGVTPEWVAKRLS